MRVSTRGDYAARALLSLALHPESSPTSVREIAIVGVPDDDLGQRIEAFVVLKPGHTADAAELTTFVTDRLSPHKRPRAVHFLDELPRNAMGKVQKKLL